MMSPYEKLSKDPVNKDPGFVRFMTSSPSPELFEIPRVPLKYTEYGFGHIIIRSPYTPYSIYLRGAIDPTPET